jgi:hypothetical protein
MGIDIYTKWKGQTEEERQLQFTGFDIYAGKFGYLREAYHGSPYITKYLLKEAYEAQDGVAKIPAQTLKERLPIAVLMSYYRDNKIYKENPDPSILTDFNELQKALTKIFTLEITDDTHESFARECTPEQIESVKKILALGVKLQPTQQSFVDFVELCERKEKETGEPCEIHFS